MEAFERTYAGAYAAPARGAVCLGPKPSLHQADPFENVKLLSPMRHDSS